MVQNVCLQPLNIVLLINVPSPENLLKKNNLNNYTYSIEGVETCLDIDSEIYLKFIAHDLFSEEIIHFKHVQKYA